MTLPFQNPVTVQERRPHVVVVGAGFGGLAAAIRLGAKGWRVTVVDRLDQPGGRAAPFETGGFSFDAGPTIVTAPFLFDELWTLAGQRMSEDVTLVPLQPGYVLRFADGSRLDCFTDTDRMRAEVRRFSPDDVAGWDAFLREGEACFKAGFEGMVDKPFLSLGDMAAALPGLVRRRADRSIHALACRHVRDPRLRMALSFHPLFIGGNPFRTSAILSLISHLEQKWGVHYAMGGTASIARGLAGLVRRQGNVVRQNETVEEILVEAGAARGVRLESGTIIPADIVVSNADAAWTYRRLLKPEHRKRWTDRKLDKAAYSMGLFVWYFGLDRRYDGVDHHTIFMGPRYKALLTDIFDRKVLADDFSLYLHRPTATDASVAPPGCDAFYVLSPVPNLDGRIDWTAMAEPYRQRIARFLDQTVLPGFEAHVVASHVVTPEHFRDRLLSVKGAGFSFEPTLTQTAWFRPHGRSEDVRGLYIVGGGTHPGAGMPGVLASARIVGGLVPAAAEFRHATA